MLKLFYRNSMPVRNTSSPVAPTAESIDEGFQKVLSARELLSTPHRKRLIKQIWDTTSLTKTVFGKYIQTPIERFASFVQSLPASENHHHSYMGGLLDHALESAVYGLKLRQSHLLPPGGSPEDQSRAGEVWSAAIVYGALMHDIAKVITDMDVVLKNGNTWSFWDGDIPSPYRVRYKTGRNYHLHKAVGAALTEKILGGDALNWLMTQPSLFPLFMFTLSSHPEQGGIIAQLISQADRASVAKALGGKPVQALSAPVESLQRKLADGLRYLVRDTFKMNQPGAQAWLTNEALWIITPQVINQLKAYLLQQGIKSIPADLGRVYGELSAHGIIEEIEEGKDVWKVDIIDGDWKKVFNMVKVPPTLIWPDGNLPKPFTGQIIVQRTSEQDSATISENSPAHASIQQEKSSIHQNHESVGATGNHDLSRSDSLSNITESDEDILALFDPIAGNDGKKNEDKVQMASEQDVEPVLPPTESRNMGTPDATIVKSEDIKEGAQQRSFSDSPKKGNPDDAGQQFWEWFKQRVNTHHLIVNDTKAMVHVVDGTYFLVSPKIFKTFCKEKMGSDNQWKTVQKRFQRLNQHVRYNSQNIHKVLVDNGSDKAPSELKGYLVKNPHEVSRKVPANNWVLKMKEIQG